MIVAGSIPRSLPAEFTRLIGITSVCAMTEVVCYVDAAHIYAGIMTGNTVQFGWAVASADWAKAAPIGIAIGSFVLGCLVVGIFRNHLKPVTRVYGAMAAFLAAASFVRLDPALRVSVELPLLAFSVALQGEAFSGFAGINLQTIVVTNNLVKFAKAFAARYINPSVDSAKVPPREEVLVYGVCWSAYFIAAGVGGLLTVYISHPLIVPIVILGGLTVIQICDVDVLPSPAK